MEKDRNKSTELARLSPAFFANYVSQGKWKYADHLKLLDRLLTYAVMHNIPRLIVNMPPRHGKSEFISKYFPAWFLGNNPDKRVILTSYSMSFAETWSKKVRDMLVEFGYDLFGVKLNPGSKSGRGFSLCGGGGMDAAGSGGPITGKGADLFIIDDPVKNDAEAHSSVIREKVHEWFKATAYTRLEPGGIFVIIMTRWHEDDLCGRILKEFNIREVNKDFLSRMDIFDQSENPINEVLLEDEEWLLLKLPAIAKENDPLGRLLGEALWWQRYPLNRLESTRIAIGSYWFSALYQQSPSPAGGSIFRRRDFRYFECENDIYTLNNSYDEENRKSFRFDECTIFAVMDLAATVKSSSDFTVVLVFALAPNHRILVLDIIREKFEGADHLTLIKNVYNKWHPTLIGIETVQYQIALIQSAIRQGLPVKQLKADKDKLSRALPAGAALENGTIYFKSNTKLRSKMQYLNMENMSLI
jgi:predicted phage terminase large subunit-like protein